MWGSAGTELSLICDGLTTDKPLLSENQILPAESETTDRLRFTPSVLSRPSAWSYLRTSTAFTNGNCSVQRRKPAAAIAARKLGPTVAFACDPIIDYRLRELRGPLQSGWTESYRT